VSLPPLAAGAPAGLDRRTARRLRRGELPIEDWLDLHGRTQEEAHAALGRFLAAAEAAGRRCVLVITGKGARGEGGGVLRRMVPRWLNEPANRARVVALAPARPRDGGEGALYLLLRRRQP
jgi:DNA-nicking Smr family endonuclease